MILSKELIARLLRNELYFRYSKSKILSQVNFDSRSTALQDNSPDINVIRCLFVSELYKKMANFFSP